MNKYSYKVLKYIATSDSNKTREAIYKLFCPTIAEMCLTYLMDNQLISHSDIVYKLDEDHAPVPIDAFFITLKGLDAIEDAKKESIKYWIPIVISNIIAVAALLISILT